MPLKLLLLFSLAISAISCKPNSVKNEDSYNNIKKIIHSNRQYKWEDIKQPTPLKTKVYGGYTHGCIDGATKLPEKGQGYIAANAKNNRLYGHSDLIKIIKDIALEINNNYNATIQVGDLGQARGGPAPIATSAHRSHQNGLDVDIWYRNINKKKISQDDIYPKSVLSFFKNKISKQKWNDSHEHMLKYAAKFKEVERILVNPHIKKIMCKKYKDEPWIHKLRPWWGHDKHFHLRLKCPENDKSCVKQTPVPDEDSCAEPLQWWFSKEAKNLGKSKGSKPREYPKLPKQCDKVWGWNS
jgi:penicillin-insensitive murein endopeptidase